MEAGCFFCEGWTGQITLELLANFSPLSFRGDAQHRTRNPSLRERLPLDGFPGLRLRRIPE
jgi:hypothetical protein